MTPKPATDIPSVALLVYACDRYEFLFKGFEFFFSRYWDFDVACNYYFATEQKQFAIKRFENIRSGQGAWANRLKYLLQDKIKEDYILFFQEDVWLNKKVSAAFFNRLFEKARSNNWQQVKLHSSPVYKTIPTQHFIEGFNIATVDNLNSDFLMSHQVTLWNKEFLISQLHDNEHPWRNERRATKRLKQLNPQIMHIDYFAENGNAPINPNYSTDLRSEYRTISFNGTLNENILSFIEQLKDGTDDQQVYALKLAYNYQHNLTHDGLERPRKVDIFKRLKNLLIQSRVQE